MKLFWEKLEDWTTTTRHTKHKELQMHNSSSAKMKNNGFPPPNTCSEKNTTVNKKLELL